VGWVTGAAVVVVVVGGAVVVVVAVPAGDDVLVVGADVVVDPRVGRITTAVGVVVAEGGTY
jgi:hypothetical protein